jgi:hypothetical protein
MSFICDKCKRSQPERMKPYVFVSETRQSPKHPGSEIAKEQKFCGKCYRRVKSL